MVKIDKGIPVPTETRVRASKYPLAEMEVGDSFFTEKDIKGMISRFAAKHNGKKFVTRKEGDGIRVWRTK